MGKLISELKLNSLALFLQHLFNIAFTIEDFSSKLAVELKIGKFKPIYLGQLQAYLQILDDKVRKPHENPSIGIVLCKNANQAYAEYAYVITINRWVWQHTRQSPICPKKCSAHYPILKKLMSDDER